MVCGWYEIEGFRFGVRSTSHAFGEWLDHVLAAYRSPRRSDDDDREATYSAVVAEDGPDATRRRFNLLYLGGWEVVRTLDVGFMAERVLLDLESILYPIRRDAVFLEVGVVDAAGALGLVPAYLVPALNRSKRRGLRYGVRTGGGVYATLELGSGLVVPPAPALEVPSDALSSLEGFMDVPARTEREPFAHAHPVDVIFERRYLEGERLWRTSRAEIAQALITRVRNARVLGGAALETVAEAVRGADVYRGWYGSTNELYELLAEVGSAVRSS